MGNVISASQMNAYRRCPAAWAYRYVDGIKIAPAWAIKGRAQHKGLEVNYRQKVESREDLPLDDVLDAFRTEAQAAAESTTEEVVLFPGESLGKIVDDGVAGLKTYQQAIAPTVQPLMVEERVTIPLPWGSTLLGIMDVVDEGLRIRDAKFPADAMRADDLMYEAQPPLYSLAYKIKTGEWPAGVVFDVVSLGRAKAPNPKAESIPITVTPARVEAELRDLRAVEEAIQAGTVYRRPSAFNCNRCGYRRLCWGNGTPKGASEAA